MTRDTPEQIYGQVLGLGYIDGPNVIRDALSAAFSEGRAAALEEMERVIRMRVCGYPALEASLIDGVRSLISRGRDEVAPNSSNPPDISGPSREEK